MLVSGTFFAVIGTSPLAAILFAQAANGLLLPICALFLLLVMNRSQQLGDYRNFIVSNLLGAFVVLITISLSNLKLLKIFKLIS